jgi:hypothetical protein
MIAGFLCFLSTIDLPDAPNVDKTPICFDFKDEVTASASNVLKSPVFVLSEVCHSITTSSG